ncbi:uncharacterized protein EV422DRAFT_565017 [Fimicolochytrium jonesii]|uniref:uncharacterized protein n=1 Tax=Fimicolochytrium jonesii TaxID=1396493 RepID=UPI0022FDE2AB|nr:uncharacterized protein EV422DRAFT_565017 [Fimicolochytrium jonesii]KAI8824319.1 hypothetical protein EV422DRAFT_565017 [Fimicolochytrium jonesii]
MPRSSKTRVSYSIREDYGDRQLHRSGINALALDETTPTEPDGAPGGILFTGGRDTIVNSWDCHIDFAKQNQLAEQREARWRERHSRMEKDRVDSYYGSPQQQSLSVGGGSGASREVSSWSRASARRNRTQVTSKFAASSRHSMIYPSDEPQREGGSNRHSMVDSPAALDTVGQMLGDHSISSSPPSSPISPISLQDRKDWGDHRDARMETDRRPANGLHIHHQVDFAKRETGLTRDKRSITFGGSPASHHNFALMSRSESAMSVDRGPKHHRFLGTSTPPTTLRRTYQHHSDWINDLVLCNNNQHIISASSDRTVCIASTTTQNSMPHIIGHHYDYVRCLAYSPHRGWVASGGLDHRILLWDLGEGRGPVGTLSISETPEVLLNEESPTASIYSLACNPGGSVLVSGSPDKCVRVWDFRAGKNVMRLQGHTENIRSLLVSDDGRRVLSSSCDSTVKMWSLESHKCMHTYSHFEDSVYSLYSTDPDLDTFWTGGKDGWVTKVSRSKTLDTSDDLLEVVAVCKEDGPVHKVVAINDLYIWTATSNAKVNRWRDIPFQHTDFLESGRTYDPADESERVIIPRKAMLTIPHSKDLDEASTLRSYRPFSMNASERMSLFNRRKDAATSVYAMSMDVLRPDTAPAVEPAWKEPDGVIKGTPGINRFVMLNNKRHVLTQNTANEVVLWDIVRCVKLQAFDCTFTEALEKCQNPIDWVSQWCSVDIHNGSLVVHLDEARCFEGEIFHEDSGVEEPPEAEEQRINIGKWVLTLLFQAFTAAYHLPADDSASSGDADVGRQPLGRRDGVESEESSNEASLPARLSLETAMTEGGIVEERPNDAVGEVPRTSLQNLGHDSIPEDREPGMPPRNRAGGSSQAIIAVPPPPMSDPPPEAFSQASSMHSLYKQAQGHVQELEPIHTIEAAEAVPAKVSPLPPSPEFSRSRQTSATSSKGPERNASLMDKLKTHVRRRASSVRSDDLKTANLRPVEKDNNKQGAAGNLTHLRTSSNGPDPADDKRPHTPSNPDSASLQSTTTPAVVSTPHEPRDSSHTTQPSTSSLSDSLDSLHGRPNLPKRTDSAHAIILPPRTLFASGFLNPDETPHISIPPTVRVIISVEESEEAAAFLDVYRGKVGDMGGMGEVEKLQAVLPTWVFEAAVQGKAVMPKENVKVAFMLYPMPGNSGPDIPRSGTRLSANRMLKMRKLMGFVVEKLGLAPSPEQRRQNPEAAGEFNPEDFVEILCQDKVAHPNMTLGAVKHHLWKGGSELSLFFQRKQGIAGDPAVCR